MPHFPRQEMIPQSPDSAYCQESNKHEILGTTGAMMTIAIIIAGLRITVRSVMIKQVGADDWVMMAAVVMAIATFICFVGEVEYAVGKHIECIPKGDYEMYMKWQYFHSIWVMVGVVLVKISIALFLMRLVPPKKRYKRFLWGAIVFLICFCLSCLGTLIFACVPIRASWNLDLRAAPGTTCFSNNTFTAIGLYNSSVNCITDFLFAIIPIPIIIKLQVNKRTKVSLACILSLGYFACAAGIVKAIKQHNFFGQADPLWHNDFNVWNQIELCVGIVAASLPALRPLFASLLDKTRSYLSSGSKGSNNRTNPDPPDGSRPSDVKLNDWKHNSQGGRADMAFPSTKKAAIDPDVYNERVDSSRDHRYTVGVTAGRDPGDDGSWEDIEPSSYRSHSDETLNHPAAIYKTTEITTWSNPKTACMI